MEINGCLFMNKRRSLLTYLVHAFWSILGGEMTLVCGQRLCTSSSRWNCLRWSFKHLFAVCLFFWVLHFVLTSTSPVLAVCFKSWFISEYVYDEARMTHKCPWLFCRAVPLSTDQTSSHCVITEIITCKEKNHKRNMRKLMLSNKLCCGRTCWGEWWRLLSNNPTCIFMLMYF